MEEAKEPERSTDEPRPDAQAAIERHLEATLGARPSFVWHELLSDRVHVDVHYLPPGEGRDFHVLVTTGMSDLPMSPPPDRPDERYAELVLLLPADWPTWDGSRATFPWPVSWLKRLARLPHQTDSWLWWGHSVPSADPPEPLDRSTAMTGWVLIEPVFLPLPFRTLALAPDKLVHLWWMLPLYTEEMELKLAEGTHRLLDRLEADLSDEEVLDFRRRNVCAPA